MNFGLLLVHYLMVPKEGASAVVRSGLSLMRMGWRRLRRFVELPMIPFDSYSLFSFADTVGATSRPATSDQTITARREGLSRYPRQELGWGWDRVIL